MDIADYSYKEDEGYELRIIHPDIFPTLFNCGFISGILVMSGIWNGYNRTQER